MSLQQLLSQKQPEPTGLPIARIAAHGTEARVCNDISERQRKGMAKYGVSVADNPLALQAWVRHAYEECLDQAVYLRRILDQLEVKP